MVLADSHRISPVPRYSGYPSDNLPYLYGDITLYVLFFQTVPVQLIVFIQVLQPLPGRNRTGLG